MKNRSSNFRNQIFFMFCCSLLIFFGACASPIKKISPINKSRELSRENYSRLLIFNDWPRDVMTEGDMVGRKKSDSNNNFILSVKSAQQKIIDLYSGSYVFKARSTEPVDVVRYDSKAQTIQWSLNYVLEPGKTYKWSLYDSFE